MNHATWECKPYCKKLLFGKIRQHLRSGFRELAQRKECRIEEGHLIPDHARGYYVSTVGRDEETERADTQLDQLQLKLASS